ncbi:MAG TPA: glycosyltransferase [Polyangiaceae bacterium]|nr:glycosyltransferase [Polyangiaceae bacterium]
MTPRAYVGNGSILYVTFDGVLRPLAFSQVVRVVVALARRGFRYRLLSVERKNDLADFARVDRVKRVLADAGIVWTTVGADLEGSARRSSETIARVAATVLWTARHEPLSLVHARGYQAGAIANALRRIAGVPYLFDARGCWIDERMDWFANPIPYAVGKFVERGLYRDAAAVVTLTELHANDVIDGAFGKRKDSSVVAIPTCADYGEFTISADRPAQPTSETIVPAEVKRRLEGRVVLGIVGALNRSYLVEPTLALVKLACDLLPRAHLLVLTQQQREYAELLAAEGIHRDRTTLATVPHADMASWLAWVDWGLLLLADTIAKRGSMPTKLAEFFAAGVRPVAYGCNSEMTNWVRRTRSGIILETLERDALLDAARYIADSTPSIEALRYARKVSAPHFSLSSGVERYETLLRRTIPCYGAHGNDPASPCNFPSQPTHRVGKLRI